MEKQTELEYQNKVFIEIAKLEFKHKDLYIFAVPNGGKRDLIEAKRMKAGGVRPGVSDLIIFGNSRAVFLELKTTKGKQSGFQRLFELKVSLNKGFKYMLKNPATKPIDCAAEVIEWLYGK